MKPTLKAPGSTRLNLKCDDPLSNFAFKFNLRRYSMVEQLVCATTHQFVGTRGSSFSGQVNNLRGYSKWMYSVLDYGSIASDVC